MARLHMVHGRGPGHPSFAAAGYLRGQNKHELLVVRVSPTRS